MATAFEVGPVDELPPGSARIVTVRGVEIGVFNVDGAYYALPNLCFHQWGPLCTGTITGTLGACEQSDWQPRWEREGRIVVCPWHSLEFDITTGQCLAYPRVKLRRYPVTLDAGIVKVHV
jgi:nitrite reductase/ring-hydroxylating ferredoxin subunit